MQKPRRYLAQNREGYYWSHIPSRCTVAPAVLGLQISTAIRPAFHQAIPELLVAAELSRRHLLEEGRTQIVGHRLRRLHQLVELGVGDGSCVHLLAPGK